MRPISYLLSLAVLASAAAAHQDAGTRFASLHGRAPDRTLVRVAAPAALLAAADFDLARHGTEAAGDLVDVVATPGDLERLATMGLDFEEVGRDLRAAAPLEGWSDLAEVMDRIDALVAAHPDLLHREEIGTSIEGRPIVAVRVGLGCAPRPHLPQVAFNANHHAREVMTVEAALDILAEMTRGFMAAEPDFVRWVTRIDTWVTPVVNPDGYNWVHVDDTWWRKNRRQNQGGSYGVDLNRNYPYAWGANDSGSSGSPRSQTYRGTGPASEPETQAMVALARRLRPVFNLSFHSYGEVILYPYGYENAANPTGDVIEGIATRLSESMARDTGSGHFGKRSRLYPVNGLDRDWYYFELGTYSFVPEISSRSRGFHPSHSWVEPTVTGLRPGWKYLLERSLGSGIRGRVVDAATGAPLAEVPVGLEGRVWKNGESHTTSSAGWFQKLVEPGSHVVTVEHEGYLPAQVEVEVGEELEVVEVALTPAG